MTQGRLYYLDYKASGCHPWQRLVDHTGSNLVFRAGPQVGAAEMVFRALKPNTSYVFTEVVDVFEEADRQYLKEGTMKVKEYQGLTASFTVTQAGDYWYWWSNSIKGVKGPFMTEADAVIAAEIGQVRSWISTLKEGEE